MVHKKRPTACFHCGPLTLYSTKRTTHDTLKACGCAVLRTISKHGIFGSILTTHILYAGVSFSCHGQPDNVDSLTCSSKLWQC